MDTVRLDARVLVACFLPRKRVLGTHQQSQYGLARQLLQGIGAGCASQFFSWDIQVGASIGLAFRASILVVAHIRVPTCTTIPCSTLLFSQPCPAAILVFCLSLLLFTQRCAVTSCSPILRSLPRGFSIDRRIHPAIDVRKCLSRMPASLQLH